MGSTVYGRVAEAGDLVDGSKIMYQPFKTNSNKVLIGLRHWMIFYDNPTITGMKCAIYADDFSTGDHLPSTKIQESTKVWSKAEIISLNNGFFEIYYDFANIPLQEDTWYHAVFYADTYTPVGDAHVAYRTGFPDPVYTLNLTIDPIKLDSFPLAMYLIGADL